METQNYEVARNKTLLFFMEHLMAKGKPRTLHDLSCQYGRKGFTDDMRRVVGGSQTGLKSLLSQCPSIFTINGNTVGLNSLLDTTESLKKRDHVQDAIDYFKMKLFQYGVDSKVPISALIGHRSQAGPQIRHVTGQNIKEFERFLKKHPESFEVIDDKVKLIFVDTCDVPQSEYVRFTSPSFIKSTQNILNFLTDCIELNGPTLIDRLYHLVTTTYLHEFWYPLFKTVNDMTTFLKLFSDSFDIQNNVVTLLRRPTIFDASIKPLKGYVMQMPINKSSMTPKCGYYNVSSGDYKVEEKVTSGENVIKKSMQSHIENLCENNCPQSNTNGCCTLYDALNLSNDLGETEYLNYSNNNFEENNVGDKSVFDLTNNDILWENKVAKNTHVITTIQDSCSLIDSIMKSGNNDQLVISVDFKFANIATRDQLSIIQISTVTGKVFIFDILHCPHIMDDGYLKMLLESQKVIKIVFDCRYYSACLHKQFQTILRNVFDVKIAHAVLQYQIYNKPVHHSRIISLRRLCKVYKVPITPIKDIHNVYRVNKTFWIQRPFTQNMLSYAAADVLTLINKKFYAKLANAIKPENKKLLSELCSEQILIDIQPKSVKIQRNRRRLCYDVFLLRQKLFQNDGNIVLTNRDVKALRYMNLTAEEAEKLRGSYRTAKKLNTFENYLRHKDKISDSSIESVSWKGSLSSLKSFETARSVETPQTENETLDPFMGLRSFVSLPNSFSSITSLSDKTNEFQVNTMKRSTSCCDCHIKEYSGAKIAKLDKACQTLSTGDIVYKQVSIDEGHYRKALAY